MIDLNTLGAWLALLFYEPMAYLAGLMFCVGFALILFNQISTVFTIRRGRE